jgi:O-antigen chain-terminating methyltransferase
MLKRPVTSDDLAQLRRERDEADRRYNEALTALDRALPRPGGVPPEPPAAFDPSQLPALNDHWRVMPPHPLPPARGLRSRLARFVWELVGPALERQEAFNSTLVDHLNRNVGSARAAERVHADLARMLDDHAAAFATLGTHLIVYLQQVTAYVDTKDRLVAGSLMAVYDALLNALTDEMQKRWESLGVRDARLDSRVAAIGAAHQDLRNVLATLQQATLTVKREMERSAAAAAAESPAADAPSAASLDSYKYVGFEDRFRGSPDEIRTRLASYVPLFAGASEVLDVGCGRGELLELLAGAGVKGRGLDLNHEMVELCRSKGLDVAEGDLLSYLESLPDGSLGGLIAIQVVEHLEPSYLMRALDTAYHKLRPGSLIVLETINPACWFAFFSSYIRDLTHVRPLHPDTLTYLLTASGFQSVRAEYRSPYPDAEKLHRVARVEDGGLADLADTVNANVDRLNALLFTHLDYAAIGQRL